MITGTFDIIQAKDKTHLSYPGTGSISDIVLFGFNFMESEDHVVAYIVAHPGTMKSILCSMPDSKIDPVRESIGYLWTARLLISSKLKMNQIFFANEDASLVLALDIPNTK